MTITVVFDPPLPSDSPAVFNTKAFTLLGDLNDWSTEANALAVEVTADEVALAAAVSSASTSASTATTQAGTATTQAGIATTQAGNALSSANAAAASYDSFDDRYLGSKSSAPTLDNDGAALLTGALYYNSVSAAMFVWTGSAWSAMSGSFASPPAIGNVTPAAATATALKSTVSTEFATEALAVTTNNLPTIRPSLNLDFANSQVVDPRITFTRASTATRTNSKGLIETVASGTPRIDYDAVTGVCKGLLIEESRVNLLTYSEQFDNAAWTKTRASVTANATTAPDGTTTADKLVEDSTASNSHEMFGSATVVSGTVYTYSVFAKADTRSIVTTSLAGVFSTVQTIAFTLTGNGAVTVLGGASTGSITALPNGWYRCTVTSIAAPSSGSANVFTYLATATTYPGLVYTGDGTSGIYIWGAQLEAGAFATSLIPTVASQVTRAADVASMTGTNFSSWYRQDEGSFVVVADTANAALGNATAFRVDDATDSNRMMSRGAGSSAQDFRVITGGSNVVNLEAGNTRTANVFYRHAVAYATNDFAGSFNGTATATDTSGSVPIGLSRIGVGCDLTATTTHLNGHLRSIAYYPKRVTNAELQALST